jgi:DNA-binding XRE family transcriptional regulator
VDDAAHLVVDALVNRELSLADLSESASDGQRNSVFPLIDRRHATNRAKGPGYASSATKNSFGIGDKHCREAYSILESNFKDAVPPSQYPLLAMETMGQRIRRMRDQKGWTQDELANLVGVTVSAVSQWELDQTENLKLLPFLRLSKLFDTDPHYLVFGPGRGAQELSRPVQATRKRPKG